MRRLIGRIAAVAAAACGLAIAAFAVIILMMWREHAAAVTLPSPTGSYPVGRTQLEWKNPATGADLAVWAWYPAAASSDAAVADYMPARWRSAIREHQGAFMRVLFKRDPAVVRVHSAAGVALPAGERAYPVVILRAGGSALTVDFTTIAEDLASHGYVVVGFDAPSRSFVTVAGDGRVTTRAPGNNVENANSNLDDPLVGRLLGQWTADAKAIVDELQRENGASAGFFRGRLDLRRLAMVGHSFGGATALQFCHVDARCRAAVDMDGIPFGSVVTEGLSKPAMFLLSDHSREMSDPESHRVLAEIDSIYGRLPQPRLYATIRTANHFSFSDQSLLNSQTALLFLRIVGFGGLDARRGLAISTDYVRTFLDVAVGGAPAAALKHLSERYAEVFEH